MASEGTKLKCLLAIIMAVLLNHGCVVETLDFSGISMDLQFSYADEPVHQIRRRSADPVQYILVVEVNVSDTVTINKIRSSVATAAVPFQVDNMTEITAVNISTVCSLNETQYQCKCEDQFVWPNDTCHSYEACDVITDGLCTCIKAFPSDGQFCQDINKCQLSPSVCGPYSNCTNEMGSYNCSCLNGFTATNSNLPISNNNTCRDINECQISPSVCGPNSNCTNEIGSYNCSIPVLEDVNECLKTSEFCGPNSRCINSIGSYNCSCLNGFAVTNSSQPVSNSNPCDDINECYNSSLVCGPNANCYNAYGSYWCFCWQGYAAAKIYEIINSSNPCIVHLSKYDYEAEIDVNLFNPMLVDLLRSLLKYISLPYSLSNTNITQVDITTVCTLNGTEYECNCEKDHVWTSNICEAYQVCDAIVGGTCGCIQALPSDGPLCQRDTNECLSSPSICGPNATCKNQLGSYNCSCLSGFTVTNSSLTISINNTCRASPPTPSPPSTQPNPPPLPPLPPLPPTPAIMTTTVPLSEYESEIDIGLFDGLLVNYLRNYLTYIPLPYTLSSSTRITNIDMTTVCTLNGTEYKCQCEKDHVWTSNICEAYLVCDAIVGGTCGCIQALPSDGPLCQRAATPPTPSTPTPSTPSPSTPTPSTPTPSIPTPSTPTPSIPTPSTPSPSTPSTDSPVPKTSPLPPPTGQTKPPITVIGMSMKMNQIFDISLSNPNSNTYKRLSNIIQSTIDSTYSKSLIGYTPGSTKVTAFRPGSVLVDYTITATSNNLDFAAANKELSSALRAQGIILAEDAFAQSDQKNFTTDQLFPLQKLDLNCVQPDFAKGQIKWTVNDKDAALDSTRYLLSNNNSTLTVKNTSESDSGRYSCIIQRDTIPYIQWQNIAINQRPTITVGDDYRVFPCDGRSVLLKCTIDVNYNIEWVVRGEAQTSGSNSITYNYNTQSGNCTEETFTCRLRDLQQLLPYSYSKSSVTVKTSSESYDCLQEEIGIGTSGNKRNGTCKTGTKGTVTYQCISRNWTPVLDNCILEAIDVLKNKVQILLVEEIPEFMANLSFATEQNGINITQSPATVKAIVDILFKVADLSKAAFMNQPVMESFLKTVDIIVSNNVTETWNKLNNDNTTKNTNVRLLNATENISDRLKDQFEINQTSIQLSRTTINGSFSKTSTLPNSNTEIVVPQVLQATNITLIIFTTLNNVLPTRNTTSNNTSGKSDLRINGDVVIVKVDQKVNNISFAFDITDQSLENPQCVFWNFNLDAWDSTGCEVKPSGNKTDKITCECNHTTSFSVLMSPFFIDNPALAYITYIGVAISMACLVICLIIEAIVWKSVTRNDTSYMRHVSIVNIALSLLIANICFIIGAAIAEQEQPTSVGRCSPAVFFMHFFYLALFFWMLISALLLFYRTVMVLSQMSRAKMMIIAFIVGYVAPLLIAVITVASTAGPQHYVSKRNACWLNWDESKALLAFVIPALTIVAINLVVLIVVMFKMLRRGVGAATQPDEKHTLFVIIRCVAFLTPIFGLTWGFGIGTMVSRDLGVHVVFTILNSLQGFFILVFGTLLDIKVRESLPGVRALKKLTSSRTKSTSAGPSSTSGLGFLRNRQRRNGYNVSQPNNSTDASTGSYSVINT